MERAEYRLTLVPISQDGKVIFKGKDYSTAAKTHNVNIDGTKYYIREDGKERETLRDIVGDNLARLLKLAVGNRKLESPLTISLTLESDDLI